MSEAPRKIVIAVDGPAASGKGTFAKALAARLQYAYLDTGALYRIVALALIEKPEDIKAAIAAIKYPLLTEQLTNPALRSPAVGEAVAQVAVVPEVRAAVRTYQAAFLKNPPDATTGAVLDAAHLTEIARAVLSHPCFLPLMRISSIQPGSIPPKRWQRGSSS